MDKRLVSIFMVCLILAVLILGGIAFVKLRIASNGIQGNFFITTNPISGKYAVVVGMANYSGTRNDLPNFTTETLAMKEVLEVAGYNVTVLTDENATREKVIRAIDELPQEENISLVFWFNGHGTQIPGLLGLPESAICLYNEIENETTFLSCSELGALFSNKSSKKTFIGFDCCMAGDFGDMLRGVTADGRIVVTASSSFTVGYYDRETGFSYIGKIFIDSIAENESVEEAFIKARTATITVFPAIRQFPEMEDQYPGGLYLSEDTYNK